MKSFACLEIDHYLHSSIQHVANFFVDNNKHYVCSQITRVYCSCADRF